MKQLIKLELAREILEDKGVFKHEIEITLKIVKEEQLSEEKFLDLIPLIFNSLIERKKENELIKEIYIGLEKINNPLLLHNENTYMEDLMSKKELSLNEGKDVYSNYLYVGQELFDSKACFLNKNGKSIVRYLKDTTSLKKGEWYTLSGTITKIAGKEILYFKMNDLKLNEKIKEVVEVSSETYIGSQRKRKYFCNEEKKCNSYFCFKDQGSEYEMKNKKEYLLIKGSWQEKVVLNGICEVFSSEKIKKITPPLTENLNYHQQINLIYKGKKLNDSYLLSWFKEEEEEEEVFFLSTYPESSLYSEIYGLTEGQKVRISRVIIRNQDLPKKNLILNSFSSIE
jgi:hypothetical protein